jgi:transcriptional regulator with XRE-family HTH domain
MSPLPRCKPPAPTAVARVASVGAILGAEVRATRDRKRWSTERLADEAGVSRSLVYLVERGQATTLETYARLGAALGLRLEASLESGRPGARGSTPPRAEDPVHASIVELLAARYTAKGHLVTVDEPFQHFQFAGRADVVAIDPGGPDLLHHEVKTALPNIGDLAGSWNAKRQYLAASIAQRHGFRHGFRTVTHVLTIAWTAECLHVLRLRSATFRSLGPDGPDAFARWWEGAPLADVGITATVVVLDPIDRPRAPAWVALADLGALRPRHRDYADLLRELRTIGRA